MQDKISRYNPQEIEPKWQKKWQDDKVYSVDLNNPKKKYVLVEFTYPSGNLHIGHWFTFSIPDMYARFCRMNGYQVFFPNGFDAFGLPAENAAIKHNIHPKDWTFDNIKRMKEQFGLMGASYNWDYEVITCESEYYKWNQWLFLKLLEKGLAYQDKRLSNWCPNCQTVLANEGVESGKCWRCGTEVIQKEVTQWFFKITDYADRLIWKEDSNVDWPNSIKQAQNEWIGKSEGVLVKFRIQNSEFIIDIFTTRPDTIFGTTYLVLAPEHPIIQNHELGIKNYEEVKEYINRAKSKTELDRKSSTKEKTGVELKGIMAINPANQKEIPIFISDYVLSTYGTGAIMAVPAHDQRDFEFAKKNNLEIISTIESDTTPYSGHGKMINSGKFNGLDSAQVKKEITDFVKGKSDITYHLHDWSVSRQRYWGTPIPIIHCQSCGIVPLNESDLPLELPYNVDYQPKGKSPLETDEEWINVACPKCNQPAKRDPDTMDTFVDSSWYFFRYLSPHLSTAIFNKSIVDNVMPVDVYFGGAEHTLGHTLYSRFITKFIKDIGLTELEEYALKRVNHGIVLGPDGNKMSKSKGNVVNPDEEVKKYGADAVRIYLAFFMPYDGTGPWVTERMQGAYRFIERVWTLWDKISPIELTSSDNYQLNKTIKKVTHDIEVIKLNTAISGIMEWLNYLSQKATVSKQEFETLLILLAPFTPHVSDELWHKLGHDTSVHKVTWPSVDQEALVLSQITLPVQINGKLRSTILINIDDAEDIIREKVIADPKISKWLAGKEIKKFIVVPLKIVSIIC